MSTQPSATKPATGATVAPAAASGEPAPHAAADVVRRPAAVARRATPSKAIALAALFALVLAAFVVVVRRQAPADRGAADADAQAQERSIDRDSAGPPIVAATTATPASGFTTTKRPVAHPFATPQTVGTPKRMPATAAKSSAAALHAPVPAPTPVVETHRSKTHPVDAEPTGTAPASEPSATETAALAPVTITGCLEISSDEDRFRLTDTEGASAPKARSWKTGFLKKRSAPVDLVGPLDTQDLQRQVGKRVAATGVLTSRELNVSSMRVVASSCN